MTKLFWCSRCKTETNHRKSDNGWTCRVCDNEVSNENAEIAIVYKAKCGPPLNELPKSHKTIGAIE